MLIHGRGLLHAMNLGNAGVPSLQALRSTNLPLAPLPEPEVFTTVVRVVRNLPYALILGTSFLRLNHSVISFAWDNVFQPDPTSTWVLFVERHCCSHVTPPARCSCVLTEYADPPQRPVQEPKPLSLPLAASLPVPDTLVFEIKSRAMEC